MILRNKSGSTIKKGFLVKAVRGGFAYAAAGDTPIGVITQVASKRNFAIIQETGHVEVFVEQLSVAGHDLRMPVSGEGGRTGTARNIGTEETYTSIGQSLEPGKGLIRVALNIKQVGAGGGGDVEEAPIDGNTYGRLNAAWSVVSGAYAGWNIVDGIFDRLVASTNQVEFLSGTDMQVQYSAPAGVHTLTFDYVGTPGTMDDWYLNVETGGDHVIQNHTQLDFKAGATGYIDVAYGFSAPRHEVIIDIDTTAFNVDYYTKTLADSTFATQAWVTSNFDDYNNWNIVDGVFDRSVDTNDQVEFVSGTDMQVQYSDVAGVHTLTFDYTGSPGTMDDWYFQVDADADHTIANHGRVNIQGGTDISLTYTFASGVHGVVINSTATGYWTLGGSDIYYTAGYIGVGTSTIPNAITLSGSTGGLFSGAGVIGDTTGYSGIKLYDNSVGNMHIFNKRTVAGFGAIFLSTGATPTPRMSIQNNGNIGIGYTGATDATYKLDVSGAGRFTTGLTINGILLEDASYRTGMLEINRKGTTTYAGIGIKFSGSATWNLMGSATAIGMYDDINNKWAWIYNINAGIVLYHNGASKVSTQSYGMYVGGDIRVTGEVESYDTSDIRLKSDIKYLDPVKTTDQLMSLDTINYMHDIKGKREFGLIAQQVQIPFPENVKENDEGTLMLHYGKMIPPILAMSQHQERRLIDQEDIIRKQGWRIAELERKLAKY